MKTIHYENESVDVIKTCCDFLYEHNFYQNDNFDNFNLLEEALSNYSIFKILEWDKITGNNNLDQIVDATSIADISAVISQIIPTEEQKKAYFAQYIHCIIYILGVINNHHQIEWLEDDTKEITIDETKNGIKCVITPKELPYEKLTAELIETIKDKYKKGLVFEK